MFHSVNIPAPTLLVSLMTVAALVFGSSAYASTNPGNEIMTASDYTFQSDTFSGDGAIGSLAGYKDDPIILTGTWSLDVNDSLTSFSSNLTAISASGAGYRNIQLSNLSSTEVTIGENNNVIVTGVLDVTINGIEKLKDVNVRISLANFQALNMTLSEPNYLDQPIYGIVDVEPEVADGSTIGLMSEKIDSFESVAEKFGLPEMPDLVDSYSCFSIFCSGMATLDSAARNPA